MMTTDDKATQAARWAADMDATQLAIRIGYMADGTSKVGLTQKRALLTEAAKRISADYATATWLEIKLPEIARTGDAQAAAAAAATPQGAPSEQGESATSGTGRTRATATGDPRQDRANAEDKAAKRRDQDARRAELDERILTLLKTYPGNKLVSATDLEGAMPAENRPSYAQIGASLRRLEKANKAHGYQGKYKANGAAESTGTEG